MAQAEGTGNLVRTTQFRCRLSERSGAFAHLWEHTIGSGHAPLALRADWQGQLRRCHKELGFRPLRFHGRTSAGKLDPSPRWRFGLGSSFPAEVRPWSSRRSRHVPKDTTGCHGIVRFLPAEATPRRSRKDPHQGGGPRCLHGGGDGRGGGRSVGPCSSTTQESVPVALRACAAGSREPGPGGCRPSRASRVGVPQEDRHRQGADTAELPLQSPGRRL